MKLLRWLSVHLRPLGRAPLLPHLLDGLLLLHSLLFAPGVLRALDALTEQARGWEGVSLSSHRFGGRQFNVGERELGHVHGNGVLDVLLDHARRDQALREGLAVSHHTFPGSGWVSLQLAGEADLPRAVALLRLAYDRRSGDRKEKGAEPLSRPALTASGK